MKTGKYIKRRKKHIIKGMNKIWIYNKGWIEALIDSEGSLSLLKEKRVHFKAGYTYKSRLNIANKNRELLEKAKKIISGGAIIGPNKKGLYNLDVSANSIRQILPKIKLINKEKQRRLLLKALDILKRHVTRGHSRTRIEIEKLENLTKKIREQNESN